MRSIKLLVADDEALVPKFLARIIKEENLPVSEMWAAESGPEAVFQAFFHQPDLVLLDLSLPGFSGREVLSLMAGNSAGLQVSLLDADLGRPEDLAKDKVLMLPGLPKPISRNQVVQLIRSRALDSRPKNLAEPQSLARIRAVVGFIEERLPEALTLSGLARFFSLSPQYLSRRFAEVLGRGVKAHIQSRRLSRAVELLRSSGLSLAEITARTGFSNQRYFATCFKARTGMTPREYRRGYSA